MRIAIFSDTYVPEVNGVAKTLSKYTHYLEERGIEYQLFIPKSQSLVPAVPHVQRFKSLPFILYPDCRLALPNPVYIKQTLQEFRPDLIHIATPFNLGLQGLHYGKKLQIPMVASYHTHFDDYLNYYHLQFMKNWIWKYMEWFHRPMEKIFVPSESTKNKLLQHQIHDEINIWGRGVDHRLFTPLKRSLRMRKKYQIKEKNILLYVGRVSPEKNVPLVIETFQSLPPHLKKDTHLLIVGDGPLLKQLKQQNMNQVTFTGFLEEEELAMVYASSDLFIFPSTTETFGNVVLEAMGSGLPVIGSNQGGVKHLIQHDKTGYACASSNELLEGTIRLLEDSALRKQFANNARQYALTQSWDRIFDQLIYNCMEVVKKAQEGRKSA